ncbi:MAG: hypothetical protein NUK65_01795 [Firmicutes bacterium]|nr:hypothetical protein [Bacillota bacterium]
MKKMTIKKKPLLAVMKSSRVLISMDTSQKIILPQKGKGSYKRKQKHKYQQNEG